jgi:acyl-CoA thioesterase YciA
MTAPAHTAFPAEADVHLVELVRPADANTHGTLFAPNGLALAGRTAYLAARLYCTQPVVMAAATRLDFVAPVPVGALLHLQAAVTRRGRSSITVRVEGWLDGCGTRALRGEFEMVAVDAHGRPTPVTRRTSRDEPIRYFHQG